MDYKKYYEVQAGGGDFPIFRGYVRQRGYGLGGMFRTFYKFVMPLFKTHALPFLKKGAEIVGTEAVKTAADIANDAIKGRNIQDSAKEHLNESLDSLKNRIQTGSGTKRKVNHKRKKFILLKDNKKSRRLKDIFD